MCILNGDRGESTSLDKVFCTHQWFSIALLHSITKLLSSGFGTVSPLGLDSNRAEAGEEAFSPEA